MVKDNSNAHFKSDEPLWVEAAIIRLNNVPTGPIRDMAYKAINTIAIQSKLNEITEEFVGNILNVFQNGSSKVTETLSWDDEARDGISRAPDMVRGMLIQEIESWTTNHGQNRVTVDIVETVKATWMNKGSFHLNPNDPRTI